MDGELPEGWELAVPESLWPEALVSAVRADPGALSVSRATETIRLWKREAKSGSDARAQREARKWLRALAEALLDEDVSVRSRMPFEPDGISTGGINQDSSVQDAFTMDSVRIPVPVPTGSHGSVGAVGSRPREAARPGDVSERSSLSARPMSRMETAATPSPEFDVDDDDVLNEESVRSVSQIDRLSREIAAAEDSALPPEFSEEDEKPTTLRLGGGLYLAARIDPFREEDEKPTASISIPDEIQRRNEDDTHSGEGDDDDDEVHEELPEERTVASSDGPRAMPSGTPPPLAAPAGQPQAVQGGSGASGGSGGSANAKPPSTPSPVPSPPPATPEKDREEDGGSRLAPKPGIVRRRAVSRKRESQVRPRAAMQQVKALHAVVLPLCEELIPLSVERRSRRFWARWREVAGDRGVRRSFIEDLLLTANDVRTLVCELIAEVQTVDVKSVYTLVQKIESGERGAAKPGVGTPERQRGPMVGASVRVEGVPKEEE